MGISGTPAALSPTPATPWDTWSPTLTNLTLGNGTVIAKFTRIGQTVFWRFKFTLGSTSAVGTDPSWTPPVTISTDISGNEPTGDCQFTEDTVQSLRGQMRLTGDPRRLRPFRIDADTAGAALSATVPFTWGTGDILAGAGFYEAAS